METLTNILFVLAIIAFVVLVLVASNKKRNY